MNRNQLSTSLMAGIFIVSYGIYLKLEKPPILPVTAEDALLPLVSTQNSQSDEFENSSDLRSVATDLHQATTDGAKAQTSNAGSEYADINRYQNSLTYGAATYYDVASTVYSDDTGMIDSGHRVYAEITTDSYAYSTSTESPGDAIIDIRQYVSEEQLQSLGLIESDGSEFLPDGSSQQDLHDDGNPVVYTIEDYVKADIKCEPAYDTASAHAELMQQLKGCW